MIELRYISRADGLCYSDFERKDRVTRINPTYIVSIDEPVLFNSTPVGGESKLYSIVAMINGDRYYIREREYTMLINYLNLNKEKR